jgi:hypothetical protein
MTEEDARVALLVRNAFQGVTLGKGVGLWEGQAIDDYEDSHTRAVYRSRDEKEDWSAISVADLERCFSSLSFFDAEGMRFHLPAFLIAEIEGTIKQDILFHLTCFQYGASARFEVLSDVQRSAVRELLSLRLADAHHEFIHPMIASALSEFWADPRKS